MRLLIGIILTAALAFPAAALDITLDGAEVSNLVLKTTRKGKIVIKEVSTVRHHSRVFETLDWRVQPGQRVIPIPKTGLISSKFTTTNSQLYSGYITLVPATGTGHVSRNLWISTYPGGAALQQPNDRCRVTGSEVSLRWSQEIQPRSRLKCRLATGTVYYLNYGNEGCTTSICEAFRNTRHSGEP